jgi:SAM-dependent methyltransferase
VGFYSRVIFPYLCDFTLNQPLIAEHRKDLLADVTGTVLEIGFGTGLNLPCYPDSIRNITTIDPNAGMHRLAVKRIRQSGRKVDHQRITSERMPFESATFDSVVSTFTLCSIVDVNRAIGEVHRVLKPGGLFYFLEHGLSPDTGVQKWQRRLNWVQGLLGDGCRLDRDIPALIRGGSFESIECQRFYLEQTPKTHGYLFKGSATRGR